MVEKGSLAHQNIITAFDVYYELLNECKTFENLSARGFVQLYSIFHDTLLRRLTDKESLKELSDDSYFKYPKSRSSLNLLTQTFMCKEHIKDPVFGENFIKRKVQICLWLYYCLRSRYSRL